MSAEHVPAVDLGHRHGDQLIPQPPGTDLFRWENTLKESPDGNTRSLWNVKEIYVSLFHGFQTAPSAARKAQIPMLLPPTGVESYF